MESPSASAQDERAAVTAPLSPPSSPSAVRNSSTYGEQWASAFGICIQRDGVAFDRARYSFLKEKLVFKMDAVGDVDPLTAFMEHASTVPAAAARRLPQRIVRGSIIDDSDEDDSDDSDDSDDNSDGTASNGDARTHRSHNGSSSSRAGATSSAKTDTPWAQYFSDETLLYEINTDLERLYPAGHETLFQNDAYRAILRHVLFVWCKLHPDVSYRQGMHDVAAVVLYAFLVRCDASAAPDTAAGDHTSNDDNDGDDDSANPFATREAVDASLELPECAEADTFLVFEAIMLYLKPFYAIAQSPPKRDQRTSSNGSSTHHAASASTASSSSELLLGEPRLFASYLGKESDDPTAHFAPPHSHSGSNAAAATPRKRQSALARICCDIQYALLQQTDPQLFYHLQNLEIVPETYCLRWIRLLLAREFDLDALLRVWDAMIHDRARYDIAYPHVACDDEYLHDLPRLVVPENSNGQVDADDDADWIGFPLLRYLCVAKLLALSKQLRAADNTGCWRLLMQTTASVDDSDSAPRGASSRLRALQSAAELIRAAQVLRDPTLATRDGPNGIDVVKFHAGSLGIILTAASAPFDDRLAVKDFVDDPPMSSIGNVTNGSTGSGISNAGQAKVSGRVFIGDILHSINGVPIVGVTTEEVKRHIQLIGRPMYMGFLHPAPAAVSTDSVDGQCHSADASASERSEISSASGSGSASVITPESVKATDAVVLPTHFLPGELCYAHVETSVQSFVLSHDNSCLSHYLSGKLWITNYRCFFTRLLGRGDIDWQVPVLSIASIDGMDNTSSGSSSGTGGSSLAGSLSAAAIDHAQAVFGFTADAESYRVVIRCKDTQIVRLAFARYAEYSKLYKCLSCLAFPASLLDAFCFAYAPSIAPSEEVPFDIRREYARIGLLDVPARLRCIDQSTRYDLCDTYPQHLIVPAAMSDVRIKAAAAFRSGARLPVVAWMHRGNGAIISRSSQPLVGFKSARSADDELLVRLLCTTTTAASTHSRAPSSAASSSYVIMDARGQLAAVGNKAMGKGTEIVSNYRGAKLVFMNIDNIHAIRQSLQSLTAVFEPRRGGNEDSASFYSKIESSGWLRHVRLVLRASVELAHLVHNGVSVLTHCSDGWDRTAQMVSLAELLLDPYYRTLRGFQCLVEKEWCSFGHQFGARCGHARSDATNDQRSPVFLLWLDCVWQFLRQHPSECEFNEKLLLTLADHVYSCKYGTFMFDCERQRKEIFAKHRVHSIWSEVNSNSELFTSQVFAPSDSAALLSPSTLSKNIKLWKGYFCRWDTTIVPPVPAFQYY